MYRFIAICNKDTPKDILPDNIESIKEWSDLEDALAALFAVSTPYSQHGGALGVPSEPHDPEWLIRLAQSVPAAELAKWAPWLNIILKVRTQGMNRRSVEKSMTGRADEHWKGFLQIHQASELSSLANNLDNELVEFIRQILG